MKLIDFTKRVLAEAKADLVKAGITDLTIDTDLPDDVVNAYTNNLLTRERAASDPGIIDPLRSRFFAEVYNGFDKDFNAFAESDLPKDVAEKIKAEKITRNKWDLIRGALPKPGTETEQAKALSAEIKKLHDALKEKDTTFETFKVEADGKLSNFQKDYLLAQEVAKLPIADSAKQFLTLADIQNKFVDAISKKGIILAMENNTLTPKIKTPEGALMDHYVGNVKSGLPDLFKTELAPYLKQSNGGGNPPPPPAMPPGGGTPPQGLTLQQMNEIEVKKKFAAMKATQQ